MEDSLDDNHALALHTKKGGRFKRNFRQNLEMRSLHQPQFTIKEAMFQKFSCSDVTNMGTMQEIVQPGRNEDNMLPPLTLTQTQPKIMKIRERRSTYSKLNMTINLDKSIDL